MESVIQGLLDEIHSDANPLSVQRIPNVSLETIQSLLTLFKKTLFPGVYHRVSNTDLTDFLRDHVGQLQTQLTQCFSHHLKKGGGIDKKVAQTMARLPALKRALMHDTQAIFDGDPAAKGHEDVILAYPSLEAIMVYRIAHQLHCLGLPLLARMCASMAHRTTGIDIHPSAEIGHHFCIDHGTGVVIGETAVIGNYVKMYQGVTVGALSVSKSQANQKRHPTIHDHVTIYARATILGGETIIGEHSIIGGNVWVTQSVPPHSKIYNKDYHVEHSK
jgi:serine O-acetyltransferase